MDISREVAFFDSFELRHGDYDVLGKRTYRRLLGLFAELVLPQPGERCIDLGCGSGAFTRRLAEFQLDLTGLDISPRCIEAARRASPHERYLVGDIRTTSFEAGAADIIVYSGVLHHCDQEAAQRRDLEGRLSHPPAGGTALCLRSQCPQPVDVALSRSQVSFVFE